jgi:hypothetical protein
VSDEEDNEIITAYRQTLDDTGLLADAFVAYCSLSDDSKRTFLSMVQQDDPKRFKDCVPVMDGSCIDHGRTGINGGIPG